MGKGVCVTERWRERCRQRNETDTKGNRAWHEELPLWAASTRRPAPRPHALVSQGYLGPSAPMAPPKPLRSHSAAPGQHTKGVQYWGKEGLPGARWRRLSLASSGRAFGHVRKFPECS